jgi:hypothetical protein
METAALCECDTDTEKGLQRRSGVREARDIIARGCKSCAAAFNVFSSFLSFFQRAAHAPWEREEVSHLRH